MRYKQLNEAKQTKGRIHHLEDFVIWYGYEGAMDVLTILKKIMSDPSEVSIKWDGSPAVIFGRDDNGEFILTDKAGFNSSSYDGRPQSGAALKKMLLNRSAPHDESRLMFADNMAAAFSVFESATPQDFRGFMFGDLLYYSTPKINNGDYVFQPNLVTYKVNSQSDIGKHIGQSRVGVVIHNKIEFDGSSTMADAAELNSGKLMVMPPIFVQTPPVVNDKALEIIHNNATTYKESIDSLFDEDILLANKMKDFKNILYSYVNACVKHDQLENLEHGFDEWLPTRKSVSSVKQERIINHIKLNKQGFNVLFGLVKTIMKAKNDVINQLDSQDCPVKAYVSGHPGGEGYVVGTGNAKLVNRSGFSAANMAKNS